MPKFRKKPVVIEAMRFDVLNANEIIRWSNVACIKTHCEGVPALAIETLEGTMIAQKGDWIIRGVAGEFYPCKPEIFAATYEPVGGNDGR